MSLILNISIFPCDAIKLHTFQLKVVALKDTSQYQDVFCVSEFQTATNDDINMRTYEMINALPDL